MWSDPSRETHSADSDIFSERLTAGPARVAQTADDPNIFVRDYKWAGYYSRVEKICKTPARVLQWAGSYVFFSTRL